MAPRRGIKLPLSVVILIFSTFVFFALLYAKRISLTSSSSSSSSSPSFFELNSCARRSDARLKSTELLVDDRFEFDSEECDVTKGKWVYNTLLEPLYDDESCPYVDRQFSCVKNGRPEADYLYWEWQPEDCTLPRFNPELALNKLRGKRLLFVGDSIQRSQWESFVCLASSIIPEGKRTMKSRLKHFVFKAKEYNASIEFYWAPFLVESNKEIPGVAYPEKRVVKVDSLAKRAKKWEGADILVFNTYVWWMKALKINALWGSFANGEDGAEELDTAVAYRLALKTWANWVDSTVDPNKTRVFFTTMSPTHFRSADWGKRNGTKCFNETKPIEKKNHWGSGSNKAIMGVVTAVLKNMKTPVAVLNVTQLSEYRIDAHASVYTETGGKLLTAEQRADPMRHADCIHWCLPGLPDTWNQILLAHLEIALVSDV